HPLPFFFDYGLRVTMNTDNRLVTNTTVSKELFLCHTEYGFTLTDLKELIVSGWKSAFLPYREKADIVKKLTKELEGFVDPDEKLQPRPLRFQRDDRLEGPRNQTALEQPPQSATG